MLFSTTYLRRNQQNFHIWQLQQLLVHKGYSIQDKVGVFGGDTEAAVRAFQQATGLKPTGKIDAATAKRLNEQWRESALSETVGFTVQGKLIQEQNKEVLAGYTVELWEKDAGRDDLLGRCITTASGVYRLVFYGHHFMNNPEDFPPHIFFRVIDAKGVLLLNTREEAQQILPGSHTFNLTTDPESAPTTQLFRVYGRVTSQDNIPAPGMLVKAGDRQLGGSLHALGDARVQEDGSYSIWYDPRQLPGGKQLADLVLTVHNNPNDPPLFQSDLTIDAAQVEEVNLTLPARVYQTPTAFTRIRESLVRQFPQFQPLVAQPGAKPSVPALPNCQDLLLLARKTKRTQQELEHFFQANTMAQTHGLDSEICYGLLRQNKSAQLREYAQESVEALTDTLRKAVYGKQIEVDLAKLPQFAESIIDKAIDLVYDDKHPFTRLVQMEGYPANQRIPEKKRAECIRLCVKTTEKQPVFWEQLVQKLGCSAKAIENLQFRLQLNDIALGHLPLITAVQRGKKYVLRDLVGFDWRKLLEDPAIGIPASMKGSTEQKRLEKYVRRLEAPVERAYPTAVLTWNLHERGKDWAGVKDLNAVFQHFPDFDFRSTPVRRFLKENTAELDKLGLDDRLACENRLHQLQRLFQVTPETQKFEHIAALLQHRLDSVHLIKRKGRSAFVRDYISWQVAPRKKDNRKIAHEIYRRADRIAMATLLAYGKFGRLFNNVSMYALPAMAPSGSNGQAPKANLALTGAEPIAAEWEELFGGLDYWQCSHCQSVFSPAAYLADLLIYLENAVEGTAAVAELKQRRPDIFHLLLNCDNALTEIPYINLVIEVLEKVIIERLNIPRPYVPDEDGNIRRGLNEGRIDTMINEALGRWNSIELSPEALVKEPATEDKKASWTIADRRQVVQIEQDTQNENHLIIQSFWQTPDKQSGALPLPIPDVYAYLKEQIHPWQLPFDLWGEEARVYLQHLGAPRYRLMEIFRKSPEEISDFAIAVEYLGMSPEEGALMVSGSVLPPYTDLGPIDDSVEAFIEKIHLPYDELLALLKTNYVNPQGNIAITNATGSPHLSEMGFENLDAEAIARIQRLKRLHRCLPWSLTELDKVIRLFEIQPVIDGQLLINIAFMRRIQELRKIPVLHLMSWWRELDTCKYEGEFSLYDQLFVLPMEKNAQDRVIIAAFISAKTTRNYALLEQDPETSAYLYLPAIQGALGINLDELLYIIESERHALVNNAEKKTALYLENLSRLFAVARFCKAFGLKIREYYVLRQFAGSGEDMLPLPLDPPTGNPQNTFTFIGNLNFLRQSKISVEELGYYLRHHTEPRSTVAPIDKTIHVFLTEVQTELKKILAENTPALPAAQTDFQNRLSLYPGFFAGAGNADFRQIITILQGKSSEDWADNEDFLYRFENIFPLPEARFRLIDRGLLQNEHARRDFVLGQLPELAAPQENLEAYLSTLPLDDRQYAACVEIVKGRPDTLLPWEERENFITTHRDIFTDAALACNKLVDRGLLYLPDARIVYFLQQWPNTFPYRDWDTTVEYPDHRELLQLLDEKLDTFPWGRKEDRATCRDIITGNSSLTYQQQESFIRRLSSVFLDTEEAIAKLVDRGLIPSTEPPAREAFFLGQLPPDAQNIPGDIWQKLAALLPDAVNAEGVAKCLDIITGHSKLPFEDQEDYIRRHPLVFTGADAAIIKLVDRGLVRDVEARFRWAARNLSAFAVPAARQDILSALLPALMDKLTQLFDGDAMSAQKTLSILAGISGMTEKEQHTFLDEHFAKLMDIEEARAKFASLQPEPKRLFDNASFVWRLLLLKSYLIKKCAETFELQPAAVQMLLEKYLVVPYDSYRVPEKFEENDYRQLWRQQRRGLPAADLYALDIQELKCVLPRTPEGDTFYLDVRPNLVQKRYYPVRPSSITLAGGQSWAPAATTRFYRELSLTLQDALPGAADLGNQRVTANGIRARRERFLLTKDRASYELDCIQRPLRKVLNVFLDEVFIYNPHAPIDAPEAFNTGVSAFRLLHKVTFFIRKLDIRPEDMGYVFETGPTVGWLDLAALQPLDGLVGAPFSMPPVVQQAGKQWMNLKKLVQVFRFQKIIDRNRSDRFYLLDWMSAWRQQEKALEEGQINAEAWQKAKAELLGQLRIGVDWNKEDLISFDSPEGFDVFSYSDGVNLEDIREGFEVLTRLGGRARDIAGLKALHISRRQAELVKDLARSRYREEQWGKIAEELQSAVLEKQRDALVTAVLANGYKNFRQVEDLYEYYLIDPLMSACFKTSRIKQAISSVQLFVQRILMNLEAAHPEQPGAGGTNPNLQIVPGEAEEWEWRKYYRVWEANRKVFLYPENWIEPELRDDKSPFYKELEDELLQDEVTQESVERVYLNYLYKLNDVARLDIRAEYFDEERKELHVFGRTFGEAPVYYYRKWSESTGIWTPWERVDLDIEGDHLVPVVFQGRLMLFWPIFKEKTHNGIVKIGSNEHPKYYEIQMAWSKYTGSAWISKKITKDFISTKEEFEKICENNLYEGYSVDLIEFGIQSFFTDNESLKENYILYPSIENNILDINTYLHAYTMHDIGNKISDSRDFLSLPTFRYNNIADSLNLANNINTIYYLYSKNNILEINTPQIHEMNIINIRFEKINLEWFMRDENGAYVHDEHEKKIRQYAEDCNNIFYIKYKIDDREYMETDWFSIGDIFTPIQFLFSQKIEIHLYIEFGFDAGDFTRTGDINVATFLLNANNTTKRNSWIQNDHGFFGIEYESNEHSIYMNSARLVNVYTRPYFMVYDIEKWSQNGYNERFFLNDMCRTFFIEAKNLGTKKYKFISFYHPFIQFFINQTIQHGPVGLFNPYLNSLSNSALPSAFELKRQQLENRKYSFIREYNPNLDVIVIDSIKCNLTHEQIHDERFREDDCYFIINIDDNTIKRVPEIGFVKMHPDNLNLWHVNEKIGFCGFVELKLMEADPISEDDLLGSVVVRSTTLTDKPFCFNRLGSNYELTIHIEHEGKVTCPVPIENIDFSIGGAYSLYNWELFFHIPFAIACRLSQNQKFEEAHKWFLYIFNPTETSGDFPKMPHKRFWMFRPFFEAYDNDQVLQDLESLLSAEGDPDLAKHLEAWEDDPFNPHLIARYRVSAYMKTVVMKYLDNLIAWGDQLFRRDTIESINEATQLYVLAAQLLGRKPESVKGKDKFDLSFSDLKENPSVQLIYIPFEQAKLPSGKDTGSNLATLFYFCFPQNEKLLQYWNTVADRLFKIRNCMNIEGVVRKLALYEPPIDPALLVRAAAAGIDLSSVLNDLYAPLPNYRFLYMLQKALEICNEVKVFGGALLAALEKKDAEELTLLRSRHEIQLLDSVKLIKKWAIDESEKGLESLLKSEEVIQAKIAFYQDRARMSPGEKTAEDKEGKSKEWLIGALAIEFLTGILYLIPTSKTGTVAGAPMYSLESGGTSWGDAGSANSRWVHTHSQLLSVEASKSKTQADYDFRKETWDFEAKTANLEVEKIKTEKEIAQIKIDIATKDLENHEKQIEQSEEVEDFLKDKYTNTQLYTWMIGQTSGLYFQAYQMAYDIAKQAEKAFRHELGLEDVDTNFIQFGYWDSLKKGLLSGEKLHHDLRRMEMAYLEKNKREYELSKHISVAMLNPYALLQLRETGECNLDIPEVLFDLDHPGQYLRRIKSVSLTIPCVAGPYTSVSAKLTLLSNQLRRKPNLDDERATSYIGIQSIATSHAQNDSGLFELNFRDERYLPFEGAGVISSWRLELPTEFRQFDYDTISDVIIHLNYTARDGGDAFKTQVNTQIQEAVNTWLTDLAANKQPLAQLISLKDMFPKQWNELCTSGTTELELSHKHFPFMMRERVLTVNGANCFLEPEGADVVYPEVALNGQAPEPSTMPPTFKPAAGFKDSNMALAEFTGLNGLIDTANSGKPWTVEIKTNLTTGAFRNLYLLVQYGVGERTTGNSG